MNINGLVLGGSTHEPTVIAVQFDTNVAMIFVRCSRLETGAAEFAWARGWLGLPHELGAQLQGKDVCGKGFPCLGVIVGQPFYEYMGDLFGVRDEETKYCRRAP